MVFKSQMCPKRSNTNPGPFSANLLVKMQRWGESQVRVRFFGDPNNMTIKEAERQLDRFLSEIVPVIGFRRIGSLEYASTINEVTALLSFPTRLLARGGASFTVWVGVRFESLSKWLDDDAATDMQSTIARPIHLLREDRSYTEWEFSNSGDLETLRDTISSDLKNYAVPFAERYSRIAELRKTLESPNKQDWISAGLNVDSRVTSLAAIRFVEGDKVGAIKTLEDGLKALEESLADKSPELRGRELRKRSFDMEYLRKRLLGNA